MSEAKISIVDEVRGLLEVDDDTLEYIQAKTSVFDPKQMMTAAYKIGHTDGYVNLVTDEGIFYLSMIDAIEQHLLDAGVHEDAIELEDCRLSLKHTPGLNGFQIDLNHFDGWTLRNEQQEVINSVITHEKGLVELGTAGGKSLIMAGLCRIYEDVYPSITVTDSSDLVDQLAETYESLGLKVTKLGKVKPDKRADVFKDPNHHVIMTNRLLNNCMDIIPDDYQAVFLYDEVHVFGDEAENVISQRLGDCPIRVGLTGTLTTKKKDPIKRAKIMGCFSDQILCEIGVRELRDAGHVAEFHIEVIPIEDEIGLKKQDKLDDLWEWQHEAKHMATCRPRAEVIAEFVQGIADTGNTLILCRPQFGKILAEIMDAPFIDKDTKNRKQHYDAFESRDDMLLIATYGTVGTGISIDRIFNEVLIDLGKNNTYIGQGIGRGIRKDGTVDYVHVYDLYSTLHFSEKQKRERLRYYKRKGYPFTEKDHGLTCS